MKRAEMMKLFKSLALSQGSYGRLVVALENDPESADEFFAELESQNFKDSVSVILYIEQ